MNFTKGLPPSWQYMKLDLFDNATDKDILLDKQKLKLTISFRKPNQPDWFYYRAKLNSPRRHYRRGVGDDWDHAHYDLAERFHDSIVADLGKDLVRINISKCYQKGYAETKTSVEGLSAIVWRDQQRWNSALVILDTIYVNPMSGANISQASRAQGIIASTKLSSTGTAYKRIRVQDLL